MLLLVGNYFLTPTCAFAQTEQTTFKLIGIDGELLKNATERLNKFQKEHPDFLNKKNIAAEKIEITQALQPFGYFKPNIQTKFTNHVTFIINKGPAIKVNYTTIKAVGPGKNNQAILTAIKNIKEKSRTTFNTTSYEQEKDDLFRAANNEGYIDAYYEKSEVLINLKSYQATVTLILQTGTQYYFGRTTFNNNAYSDAFLNRFINYREGEAFSNQKVLDLQQAMSDSFYFQQVKLLPNFDSMNQHHIPIQADVTLPKSQRYSFGIGYGTFTGPRLTTGATFRRLTNDGQHVDFQARLSTVQSGISGKYYIPGKNPLKDKWVIGINMQKFVPKHGTSNSKSVMFGYSTTIYNIITNANINFLTERYALNNQPTRSSRLLYPSLNLSYIKADDLMNPRSAKSINLTLKAATQQLLSTTSFAQINLKGKYIVSPFSFARIIARGNVGITQVNNLNLLPLSMSFFAGGLNSIRGFPDSSIGPGKYLMTASGEYQNKIAGNWSGAIFYDIGSASNSFGSPLNKGVGVGIIYSSIIGEGKIYLAKAISKKDQPYSIEFSIGPEF